MLLTWFARAQEREKVSNYMRAGNVDVLEDVLCKTTVLRDTAGLEVFAQKGLAATAVEAVVALGERG